MAGTELAVKLGILGIVLLGIGVAIFFGVKEYKKNCKEGFWACVGLGDLFPSPDPGPSAGGGGGGAGPGAGDDTTPLSSRSPNYSRCTRYFNEDDKTKTCYDPDSGTGGVGWFWSNTRDGVDCKNLVQNYKIDVSSAQSSHNVVRSYVLNKKNANGVIFNNARTWTVGADGTRYNMLINVTPYDKDGKVLADPLMGEELNPESTSKSCGAIGVTPIDFFSSFELPPAKVLGAAPPPPPPVNCEGSYQPSTACVSGPYCGDMGTVTQKFVVTKVPQNGGTSCPTNEKSTTCTKKAPCTEHPSPPAERPSCKYGGWNNELTASYLGVNELFPDRDPKDGTSKGGTDLPVCSKKWRDGPDDPPGKRKQYRYIENVQFHRGQETVGCVPETDDTLGTDDPNATERTFDCNENYYKPVDCAGEWSIGRTATFDFTERDPGPGNTWSNKRRTNVYEVWEAIPGRERGLHGGDDTCPAHETERIKTTSVTNR